MELRRIGQSELMIAPLVLGGNVFGWTADEPTSFAILDAFLDAGFNALDTSDNYSSWVPGHVGGESEAVIGAWLKARGCRDRIVLATKIGAVPHSSAHGGVGRGWRGDLSGRHLIEAVERSLARLRTDYLDLCQSHVPDLETPIEETLKAYDSLMQAGKVRVIGASNHDAKALSGALDASEVGGLPRYQSLQCLYNLHDRVRFEDELQQTCVDAGVGVLCYGALARGFLTGAYRGEDDASQSQWAERVRACLNARGHRILTALDEVAAQLEARPGEVALAWLLTRPGVAAPIAAVNDVAQLRSMTGAVDIKLDCAQIELLSAASDT